MPEKIAEYLKSAGEQIRWKRARPVLLSELRTHLSEQKDDCLARGMDEAAAEAEALRQMGDPVSVGQALNRVHRPAPQRGLLLTACLLAAAGGILRVRVLLAAGPSIYVREKVAVSVLLGVALLLGTYFLDYTILGRYPKVFYWGTVLLGVWVVLLSPRIAGAVYYGSYVTLLSPVAYAVLLCSLRGRGWSGLLLAVAYGIPPLMIALLAPSVFGAALLLASAFILALTAIRKGWFSVPGGLATGLVLGLPAAGTALFLLRHWQGFSHRMAVAFHPELYPDGGGYQATAVLNALSGAELWGRGSFGSPDAVGNYRQLISSSDFLLTSLIHFFGWIPFLLLCGALLGLVIWIAVKCRRQANALGQMVSMAIVLTIGLQSIFGILMNLGFVLMSVPCPFVAGNLHTVLDMALMGLLLSVFRQERLPAEETAAFAPKGRKRISFQDGNLIVALDRRNRA